MVADSSCCDNALDTDFGGAAMYKPEGFGRERVVGKSFYMAPEVTPALH